MNQIEVHKKNFPERILIMEEFLESENQMNTELTKKEQTNLPAQVVETPWGSEGAYQQDIIIPKLLLQQALSDAVSKGNASVGDIIESINGEVLATKSKGLEIIPFMTHKEWMIFEKGEYKGRVPYGPTNAHWKYEETVNGVPTRRDSVLNFFVVLPSRLNDLPYLVSFRRSSFNSGKKLSTHFQTSKMRKLPPAHKVFTLSSQQQTIDKNTFWTLDVKPARDSKKEELSVAYQWYQSLTGNNDSVSVDHSDEVPF